MAKAHRVALLIDTSTSWGISLITGISQFAHEHCNWLLHVEPRGCYERFCLPRGWVGDGVIARVNRKELAEEILAAKLPAVNVSWYDYKGMDITRCSVSEIESGQMAANYFLSIGIRHFAYCGPVRRPEYTDQFAKAYSNHLAENGFSCNAYSTPAGEMEELPWNDQLNSLVEWLKQLPKGTGLLCWSATRGRQVTEACQYAEIRVPDEIAVLGGDHDELMSMISMPPLSTIDQPAERIGFEAAKSLHSLMLGEKLAGEMLMLPPTRVNVRQSTDILAVNDYLVRSALQLIQEQAKDGINVAQIVSQLMVARRALEQRFVKHIGRTPANEIRRVRIEAAQKLLIETKKTMAEIARETGFGEQDLFSRIFRRNTGMTPTKYREIHHNSR